MRTTLVFLLSTACASRSTHVSGNAAEGQGRFAEVVGALYAEHLAFRPSTGVELGQHQYDGKLPDRSAGALSREIARLRRGQVALEGFAPESLGSQERLERDVFLAEIQEKLFELETLKRPWKNPIWYAEEIDFSPYVSRAYAPVEHRARAIMSLCKGMDEFLAQARANLETAIPSTWLDTAILQVGGNVDFVRKDVPLALGVIADPVLATDLAASLTTCVDGLSEFREFLVSRKSHATQDFAMGEEAFLRMLAETQGVDADLARLKQIANEDLQRNLTALHEAAGAASVSFWADGVTRPLGEIVERAAADKPKAQDVLAEATRQASDMRKFLLDKSIVSIASEDVAEVRESPPFMRWNGAFLDSAGVFEQEPLPSFYYVSPPDPAWPEAEQLAYIPARADLLFTTIHEVWPGHFLHSLHMRKSQSSVLRSFCTYSMVEGWAHYVEEMMWDEGVGGGDPKVHIGQLKEALLRNVRFLAAIGLHAEGMTVEEATTLFQEKAFADPATARQQAVRGTFDPMYVSYTLGKLMIRKLRSDWQSNPARISGGVASLKSFHDRFLAHACAPVPVIRRSMLGADSGEAL